MGEVNVIVEGPSEAIALPRLVDSLRTLQRTTVRPDQIMMIPRHGASKVPPFAHLVAEMGLGLVILLDNDLEGRTAKDKISQTPALSSTPVLMIPLVTSAIAAEFEDLFPEDLLIEATAEYITHRNWELTVTDFHDLYIREPAAVNQKWSERLKKVLSFKHYLAPGQNVKDVVDKAVVMAKVVDRLSPNTIPSFVAQDFLSAVQNVLHTRSTAPVPGATERQNPPARATTLLHEANFTDTLEHDV